MDNCVNINPASCGCLTGKIPISTPASNQAVITCKTECASCMKVQSPVIQPKDGVGPCGKSASLDMAAINNYSACSGDTVHSLLSYDKIGFSSVTMTSAGVIEFVTSDIAVPGSYYNITYKAICETIHIGGFGTVRVGINNLCSTVVCEEFEVCNSCSGVCEPMSPTLTSDISLEMSTEITYNVVNEANSLAYLDITSTITNPYDSNDPVLNCTLYEIGQILIIGVNLSIPDFIYEVVSDGIGGCRTILMSSPDGATSSFG